MESPADVSHAALFIDFDNVTMGIRSDLQNQLRKLLNSDVIKGKVSVQRAYADWRRYPQYIVPLSEASIDLIFAPAVGATKKNATDIRLAIDALELVFTRPEIGTFILLSGDSDFSALVLKLKEYGKYIVGVGIRESSSDLLIQNCDEYYSYSELTGLAKEGDVEHVRRDPWELVVEAVQQMGRDGDVMRSDRLKQVMQSIDPNFDEKDAGFNRFSKFVVGAAGRGLLKLTKMDNGQYEVALGENANVLAEVQPVAKGEAAEPSDGAARPRRRRGGRKRAEGEPASSNLSLSESFGLLKQALMAMGAVGEKSTAAERARAEMVKLHGDESDPIFETRRFQRMLRQAHDAEVIELIKGDGDDYLLKLSEAATVSVETASAVVEPADGAAADLSEEERKRPSRSTRTARPGRGQSRRSVRRQGPESLQEGESGDEAGASSGDRAGESRDATTEQEPAAVSTRPTHRRSPSRRPPRSGRKPSDRVQDDGKEKASVDAEPAAASVSAERAAEGRAAVRESPRRKGSRGATTRPATAQEPEPEQSSEGARVTASLRSTSGSRSVGIRRGSRGAKQRLDAGSASNAAPSGQTAASSHASGSPASEPGRSVESAAAGRSSAEEAEESVGILRKMTAALQRAVQGTPAKDRGSDS